MQRIAFVGLGKMGEPMVANLLKKGFEVTVVGNRRPEPVERLRALGAKVAATPAEAASGADLAILVLPTSAEVEASLTGPEGMAGALAAGSVVVDCSTSEPDSTRKLAAQLAERGVGFVDAGMTRGVVGAKQGKLAYFIGGSAEDFAKVRPALEAMGDTFFEMGPVGAGHETKNLSNALSYGTVALVGEVLLLGKRFGLDLNALQEALMSGASSKALESFGPRIIEREYAPARVSVGNVRYHLQTTRDITPEAVSLELLPRVEAMYERLVGMGLSEKDMSALAELWERAEKV